MPTLGPLARLRSLLQQRSAADPLRDYVFNADRGFLDHAERVAPPAPGETWYHGRGAEPGFNPGRIDKNQPLFLTRDMPGALWYAGDRGAPGAYPYILGAQVDAQNPARYRDLMWAKRLAKASRDDVPKHSGYDGENEADLLYVPRVRDALKDLGFDSYLWSDTLSNDSIDALVPLNPRRQVQWDWVQQLPKR